MRYFDSQESIGKIAAHCIGILLAIAKDYESHSHDPTVEKLFESLPEENTAMRISEVSFTIIRVENYPSNENVLHTQTFMI